MVSRAYQQLTDVANRLGTRLEEKRRFQKTNEGRLICMTAGSVTGDVKISCRGLGNSLWRSHGSDIVQSRIEIVGSGNTLFLGGHSRLRNGDIRLKGDNCLFFLGALSTTGSITCIAKNGTSIIIGEDCMFSTDVEIETADHHGIYDQATGGRINWEADIVIGNHVWVGRGVSVGKGAIVGANSVIGQRSLVTGKLDENCVYAGVPARKLRDGIEWSRSAASTLEEAGQGSGASQIRKRRADFTKHLDAG